MIRGRFLVQLTVRRTATPIFEQSLLALVLEHGREAKVGHFQIACEVHFESLVSADDVLGQREGIGGVTNRSRRRGSSLA